MPSQSEFERNGGRAVAAVIFAGVAAALNIGKLPPALPVLQQSLGMTLVQASFLVSAFQAAGMCFGLFGGVLADRFGARRAMACGLAVLLLAGAAGAMASSVGALLALRALESAGFILTVLPGPALLRRVVRPQTMSLALGFWGTYMPTGMSLALVLTPWLIALRDWQLAWWFAAAGAALALALLLRVLPPDPPRERAEPRALRYALDTVRSRAPWLLAAAFALYAGQFIAVFSFLPTVYQQAGIAATLAGSLTAFGVAVNLGGNIVAGLLLHRGFTRQALMAAASVAMAVFAVLAFDPRVPFAARYAAIVVFSAFGGLIPGTLFATAPRFAPYPGAVSSATGLMMQGSSFGQFVSPPLVAWVASAAGGWQLTGWVTGAFALANVLVAAMIGSEDRRVGSAAS
ncbi:MAG: MFS transporter [Burkholderiaceae bacterium]|nr:MFS transporter [Burkholderiaceae bacterium]